MKILFLDIDGVLNSERFWKSTETEGGLLTVRGWEDLDPRAVGTLNHVLRETGAKVVISSSWRIMMKPEEILRCLQQAGFEGEIIGETPDLSRLSYFDVRRRTKRGDEIQQWIDEHQEYNITEFAIVDDDEDMVHLSHKLVKTTFKEGLTLAEAKKLIEVLQA